MQKLSFPARSVRTRVARIGVATGVIVVSVFGTVLPAHAQTTTNPTVTTTAASAKTPLTQAQLDTAKACMASKGFTVKTRGSGDRGTKGSTATTVAGAAVTTPTTKAPKVAQTAEQRAAREAAATACGLPSGGSRGGKGGGHGGRGHGGRGHGGATLTDAQKACLTGKGITVKTAPVAGSNTTGTTPARVAPTEAERAARKDAETACGITRSARTAKGTATTPTTVAKAA